MQVIAQIDHMPPEERTEFDDLIRAYRRNHPLGRLWWEGKATLPNRAAVRYVDNLFGAAVLMERGLKRLATSVAAYSGLRNRRWISTKSGSPISSTEAHKHRISNPFGRPSATCRIEPEIDLGFVGPIHDRVLCRCSMTTSANRSTPTV
jgi:hypothetical protein